jgi:hypothetical protein
MLDECLPRVQSCRRLSAHSLLPTTAIKLGVHRMRLAAVWAGVLSLMAGAVPCEALSWARERAVHGVHGDPAEASLLHCIAPVDSGSIASTCIDVPAESNVLTLLPMPHAIWTCRRCC